MKLGKSVRKSMEIGKSLNMFKCLKILKTGIKIIQTIIIFPKGSL